MPSLHLSQSAPLPRRFASKVDWWIPLLLVLPLAFVVGALVMGTLSPVVLVAVLVPQFFVLWILARTRYLVTTDGLTVRCGPFSWTVPATAIRSLSATRNPLSSPALSLDRIAVRHTGGLLMVSPRNKAGFVRAVRTCNRDVTVDGLPGADNSDASDDADSGFDIAPIVPIVVLGILAAAFGGWQFYAGTRAPGVTVTGDGLAVSGLYSTQVSRQDVVRVALQDQIGAVEAVTGSTSGGGHHLRGLFDIEGLGRSRVFIVRDAAPFLVIQTRTQPLVINFDDPARTVELYRQVTTAWHLTPPG